MKIINDDEELRDLALRFSKLSDEEKIKLGQKIIDKTGEINNVDDSARFILVDGNTIDPATGKPIQWNGLYNNNIIINKDAAKEQTLDGFINTLSHENAHRVDYINPNAGVLGAQKLNLGYKIYQNTNTVDYNTYKNNWTEQSSFTIGDRVGNGFEKELKKTHY